MATVETVSINDLINVDADAELARRFHLDFMQYCWAKPEPLIVGLHTRMICDALDKAVERYGHGISTFLIITIPFRHGKTDAIPRYFVPHFMGEYPNAEILCATYSAEFANIISRFARDNVLNTDRFKRLYPDIGLKHDAHNVQNWKIASASQVQPDYLGEAHFTGIGGGVTGKGYNLGIIDDFLKNRKDAESHLVRDHQWQWLKDVFLTRRGPTSITIIDATPWNVDDLIGRIENEMQVNDEFPRFDRITLPAFSDEYESGVLFPERYSIKWYNEQRATLGSYGTASLMQCNPVAKGGNILKTDMIQVIDEAPDDISYIRIWDLASTEKELDKDDPDYTVGTLMGIRWEFNDEIKMRIPHIYIKDVKRFRAKAPERNRKMIQQAKIDPPDTRLGIEAVAGYKDTFDLMDEVFDGIKSVEKITVSKDKRVRVSEWEPAVEAGHLFIVKGDWNDIFIDELTAFPSGKHDDIVDSISGGFDACRNDFRFEKSDRMRFQKRDITT